MKNSTAFALRMISIPVVAGLLAALWCDSASASEFHPTAGTAKGNPPSAARAQMARYNVPGGCVVTLDFKADGSIVRHSYCEYSPALLSRLATTGR